jgi:hypothetical protein
MKRLRDELWDALRVELHRIGYMHITMAREQRHSRPLWLLLDIEVALW